MNDGDEFSGLDDVAFLAERRRVREALEHVSECEQDPEMSARFDRMTEEFDRRARSAWTGEASSQ
jgi:hypothetical protein